MGRDHAGSHSVGPRLLHIGYKGIPERIDDGAPRVGLLYGHKKDEFHLNEGGEVQRNTCEPSIGLSAMT